VTQRRSFPFINALLVTLVTAGLVAVVGGAAVAVYANSPANRVDNPLSAVGVYAGVVIAAAGAIVAVICSLALVVRARHSRHR
jgi:hypothetical protein